MHKIIWKSDRNKNRGSTSIRILMPAVELTSPVGEKSISNIKMQPGASCARFEGIVGKVSSVKD